MKKSIVKWKRPKVNKTSTFKSSSQISMRCSIDIENIKNNENILDAYNEKQIIKIKNIGGRLINVIDTNVNDFVEYSKTSKNDIKLELGIIPKDVAMRISKDVGVNISGRSLVLSSSGINHSLNKHSTRNKRLPKNEIAINKNDFNYIANIIANYDKVEYKVEKNDKGQIERKLVFSTNTSNAFGYKLVEVNLTNGYEVLLKDLYKYNKKRFVTSVDTDNQPLPKRPKNEWVQPSKIVSQILMKMSIKINDNTYILLYWICHNFIILYTLFFYINDNLALK